MGPLHLPKKAAYNIEWASDATARLKMAEPAELSHFEPSRAIKLAHNQNGLGSAHELAQPG